MNGLTLLSLDGYPCVEIADAAGEVFLYRLTELLSGVAGWSVRLSKLDVLTRQPWHDPRSGEPASYLLRWQAGFWSCGCPDWQWRFRPTAAGPPAASASTSRRPRSCARCSPPWKEVDDGLD